MMESAATKGERIEQLRWLLARQGVVLEGTDEGLLAVGTWFFENVYLDPTVEHGPLLARKLAPEWFSVCHDLAMFFGEACIERHPNLYWEFLFVLKRSVSYQRPVITGFKAAAPKSHFDYEFEVLFMGHGYGIMTDRELREQQKPVDSPYSPDEFVTLMQVIDHFNIPPDPGATRDQFGVPEGSQVHRA